MMDNLSNCHNIFNNNYTFLKLVMRLHSYALMILDLSAILMLVIRRVNCCWVKPNTLKMVEMADLLGTQGCGVTITIN